MTNYPLYRKYVHGRTFFKIISTETFTELSITGSSYYLKQFEAVQFPMKQFIKDMIEKTDNRWMDSNSEEYEQMLDFCKKNLSRTEI